MANINFIKIKNHRKQRPTSTEQKTKNERHSNKNWREITLISFQLFPLFSFSLEDGIISYFEKNSVTFNPWILWRVQKKISFCPKPLSVEQFCMFPLGNHNSWYFPWPKTQRKNSWTSHNSNKKRETEENIQSR